MTSEFLRRIAHLYPEAKKPDYLGRAPASPKQIEQAINLAFAKAELISKTSKKKQTRKTFRR
jgi:hypothetical protein